MTSWAFGADLHRDAGAAGVVGGEAGAGEPGFGVAGDAAGAQGAGALVVAGRGERDVAPFAADGVDALDEAAVHHDAAADAGAEDDAEDDLGAGAAAVHGFGKSEAVGIVGDFHRAVEDAGEVAAEVAAVQPGGVALGDVAGGAVDGAGDADADALDAAAGFGLEALEEAADGLKAAFVVEAGGGDAGAGALGAVGGEHDAFDLGAAVVETQTHRTPPALRRVLRRGEGSCNESARQAVKRRDSQEIFGLESGWKAAGKWLATF